MENDSVNNKNIFFINSEQKLTEALKLYFLARELKTVGLRMMNPNMTEQQIQEKVKEIFLNARS
ncbi:MAG: hypothetical protein WC879_16045 [Melioribacteraceae bacterium]